MIHFDQLNVIAHHIHAIETGQTLWDNPTTWPDITNESVELGINKGMAIPWLTRQKVLQSKDTEAVQKSEWKQLNRYHLQGMFGDPCPDP